MLAWSGAKRQFRTEPWEYHIIMESYHRITESLQLLDHYNLETSISLGSNNQPKGAPVPSISDSQTHLSNSTFTPQSSHYN